MVVDQLGVRSVEVVAPSADTWKRLDAAGVTASHGRIVDLTLAGTRYETMKAAIDVLSTDPELDLLVSIAGSSARFHPELAVQPAIDSADTAKPIAVFATAEAPDALRLLALGGVPAFRTPESCADSIAGALRRRPPGSAPALPAPFTRNIRLLDEAEAYRVLASVGLPVADYITMSVGHTPGPNLAYPVAVKALSAGLPHKSDVGGVVLNVTDPAGVADAARRIAQTVADHQPDIQIERVLIQSMVKGVAEVLVGFHRDADVGPIVLLALGGVLAELSDRRALRLAPVTRAEAIEMIEELGALRALKGYRGSPPGDLAALAAAIVAMSKLAHNPAIIEAEINPLIVRSEGKGVIAVDALVRLGEP